MKKTVIYNSYSEDEFDDIKSALLNAKNSVRCLEDKGLDCLACDKRAVVAEIDVALQLLNGTHYSQIQR